MNDAVVMFNAMKYFKRKAYTRNINEAKHASTFVYLIGSISNIAASTFTPH